MDHTRRTPRPLRPDPRRPALPPQRGRGRGCPRPPARRVVPGRRCCVHPIRGVYHVAQLPAGIDLRLACLRLVVPEDAVVTDRTAGWLYGAVDGAGAERPPGRAAGLAVPAPPAIGCATAWLLSGERSFLDDEVVELGGVRVTSALRTTCDLGRLWHRDTCVLRHGGDGRHRAWWTWTSSRSWRASSRFRGYRWVTNLRDLRASGARGGPSRRPRRSSCCAGPTARTCRGRVRRSACRHPMAGSTTSTWASRQLRYGAEYDGVGVARPGASAARRGPAGLA